MSNLIAMVMPAASAVEVTPSDTDNLAHPSRALYVGATGNVKVRMLGGDEVTFVGVPAGKELSVQATRVFATGTTASSIVSLY